MQYCAPLDQRTVSLTDDKLATECLPIGDECESCILVPLVVEGTADSGSLHNFCEFSL